MVDPLNATKRMQMPSVIDSGTQTMSVVDRGTQTTRCRSGQESFSLYNRPIKAYSRSIGNIIEKVGIAVSIAMIALCCVRGNVVGAVVCGAFAARFALMSQSKENLGPELSRVVRVLSSLAAMTFCCLSGNLVSIIVAAVVL